MLYGGAVWPLDPFYLGLYGGSGLPGVLDSDTVARELYRLHGYDPIDRTLLFAARSTNSGRWSTADSSNSAGG